MVALGLLRIQPHTPKCVCKLPYFFHGHPACTLLPDSLVAYSPWVWGRVLTACFFPSCWLSLEGGLLYAFVGPAAAVVLVLTQPLSSPTSQSGPLGPCLPLGWPMGIWLAAAPSPTSSHSVWCAVILLSP